MKNLILSEDNAMNYLLEEDTESGIYLYLDQDLSDAEIEEKKVAWERGEDINIFGEEITREDLDVFNTFEVIA